MRRPIALSLSLCVLGACTGRNHGRGVPPGSGVLNVVAFETQVEFAAGVANASDIALADLTGDGVLDIAVIDLGGAVEILVGQGGGIVAPGGSYSVASGGSAIRAVDLDNDGDLDLVVGSFRQDVISVLRNDGAGAFSPAASVPTAPVPVELAAQDCNDDGIVDLLLTHFSPSFIEVFLGIGDGTFQPAVGLAIPSGGRTAAMQVADVTGDGNTDVVLADTDGEQVVIYRGDSAGLHDDVMIYPVAGGPFGLALADVTGDGAVDIMVSKVGASAIEVLRADGAGGFVSAQVLQLDGLPGFANAADVTGDGIADLVVTRVDTRALEVFAGRGDATTPLAAGVVIGTTGVPLRPLLGDLNGDGNNDVLVAATGDATLELYLGRGAGIAGARQYGSSQRDPFAVVAAELVRGNASTEIVSGGLGDPTLVVWRSEVATDGSGDPALVETRQISLADSAPSRALHNLTTADLDGDGDEDLVATVEGGVKVVVNDYQLGLEFAVRVVPSDGVFVAGDGPFETVVADVDGDAVLDLIVAFDRERAVRVALGSITNGVLSYDAPSMLAIPEGPGGLVVGDFDADGTPELAVSLLGSAIVRVFEFGPNGELTAARDLPVGSVPSRLSAADFNSDGRLDLVVSNSDSNTISLLLSSASGAFDKIDIAAGLRPTALLTTDLDRDGAVDILVASLVGADLRVILGDGRGGVAQSTIFPGVYTAVTAALADLNGNGLPDLTIGAFEAKRIAVFKNISF